MNVWLAISLILAVISIYMLSIEGFSVALKLTGMATKKINFQVASLFTGSGFTTNESELIVNDDRRRKIATACMYFGHIFSVIIMGLVINVFFSIGISLSTEKKTINPLDWYFIIFYIACGIFLLVLFLKIPPINRRFQKFLENIAINASKESRNTNIITVLDYYGKNAIAEVKLNNIPDYAVDVPLFEMNLTKRFVVNILSIKRGKRVVEVTKDTMFAKGDVLIIYGLINDIKDAFIYSVDKNKTVVIDNTNDIGLLNNYGANALMEVDVKEVPKELENVKMKDSHITDLYNINIVVIKRKDVYLFADKDTIIQKGDIITLFGPHQSIKHLFGNSDK